MLSGTKDRILFAVLDYKNSVVIDKKIVDSINIGNYKYAPSHSICTIQQAKNEYKLDDVLPTDTFLDIGACIGGVSIPVANKVSKVYSVEPILTDQLRKNIELNNIKNIKVLDTAIGHGGEDIFIRFGGRSTRVNTKTLSQIIDMCGGHADFLKIDCEGGEWGIQPDELKGFRRIEAEIHSFKGMPKHTVFLKMLDGAGFKYTVTRRGKTTATVSAHKDGEVSSNR